jgi:hypothetical protein
LLRPLERGSTGQVHLALSPDGQRTAAFKIVALADADEAAR